MGILSDFFLSTEADVVRYNTTPEDFPHRIQTKGFTPLEVATLWACMSNIDWSNSLIDEVLCVCDFGEEWIYKFPKPMQKQLSGLSQQQVFVIAECWSRSDELVGADRTDLEDLVRHLSNFAKQADGSDRALFLWNAI